MRKRGSRGSAARAGPPASTDFLAALQAQRDALSGAAPQPPPPQSTPAPLPGFVLDEGRHWPASHKRRVGPATSLQREAPGPLQAAPQRASALALLRSRELGGGGAAAAAAAAAPTPLQYLHGLLSSCVRAWAPEPLQGLPRALPPWLERAVPAALCVHPGTAQLAWNAAGGMAQWAGGLQWAHSPTDSAVTALAWDASGAHLARATLGGSGACASLCVASALAARPAITAGAAAAGSSSGAGAAAVPAALRLPKTASVWGLAWLAGSSSHLCMPLEAGGRAALVRREPTGGALVLERTFACSSGSKGSDALAVSSALEGSSSSGGSAFLLGLRDGRVYQCDTRSSGAPALLLRLPGPPSAMSPLPSVSPYTLLGAVTHSPQAHHMCTLWDVRRSSSPLASLQGFHPSFKHRPSVLPECGLIAAFEPHTSSLQCWVANSTSLASGSLLPTWRTRLSPAPAGAAEGAQLQLHALALRSLPDCAAEVLALGSVCEEEGGGEPTLVLQRFSRGGGARGRMGQGMGMAGEEGAEGEEVP